MAFSQSSHRFTRIVAVFALFATSIYSHQDFGASYGIYHSSQNFKAAYGSSPAPFSIDVDPDFIAETVLKVSHTRYTIDIDEPDFTSGPPRHNVTTVRNYWVNHYDWFDVQNELNRQCVLISGFLWHRHQKV